MKRCWCQCNTVTRGRFAPGHDAKFKKILKGRHANALSFPHPANGHTVTAMALAEEMGDFWVNLLQEADQGRGTSRAIDEAARAAGEKRAGDLMARLEANGKALHQMRGH